MHTPIEPLPDQTVLLHVGFHKTGTTALQSAFANARPRLAESGVLYPGKTMSHHRAAMAVTDRRWGWGDQSTGPKYEYWESLVRQTRKHAGRVVISSEALALAKAPAMDTIVERLGADRLHIVMTLRPVARLLPSSYQQYLKYGLAVPYQEWLEQAFAAPPKCPPSPNFWRRNDHAGIAARWADRLGPERVTLVMLDESDRSFLFNAFEQLVGLPGGTLVPDRGVGASNRSMTGAEAEMLRQLNEAGGRRWAWPEYERLVRRGAVLRMVETRRPGPDELPLGTPEWAVEAARAVGRTTAERIAELGINVHGDLMTLADPMPAGEAPTDALCLPVRAASEAVLGTVTAARSASFGPAAPEGSSAASEAAKQREAEQRAAEQEAAQDREEREAVDKLDLPAVRNLTTRETAQLLQRRVRRAASRRMRRLSRRLRPSRRG